MPAAAQRSLMSPGCQRFTLRAWSRHDLDHGLHRIGPHHGLQQRTRDAESGDRQRLDEPLAKARRGIGVHLVELGSERPKRRLGLRRVRFAQAARSFRRTQGRSACTR